MKKILTGLAALALLTTGVFAQSGAGTPASGSGYR